MYRVCNLSVNNIVHPIFYSAFMLSTIEDDPRSVKGYIDLTKGKLWKMAIEK